jgi:chitinase
MISSKTVKSAFLLLISLFGISSFAQLPSKVLVGYWHNWDEATVPFIELANVDDRFNVVCLSFAHATGGAESTLAFSLASGSSYDEADLAADVATLQGDGKTVLMSVGGANGSFKLSSASDKNTFVSKMKTLIQQYGVDGIDIDLEQTYYVCSSSGSLSSPETHIQNLIDGVTELMTWYQTTYGKKMILTSAPEVTYVQGGLSPWNSCNGSYLPFLEQLNDEIDLIMVQLYNSGEMYGLEGSTGSVYYDGTAGFLTSQTEALIQGFTIANPSLSGTFSGFPASKVVIALPANNCGVTAGSGYLSPTTLIAAMDYLMGEGPKEGTYTLQQNGGYPDIRGMMTWSINNDALGACGSSVYEYADTFESLFGVVSGTNSKTADVNFEVYPNPATELLNVELENGNNGIIEIVDLFGQVVLEHQVTSKSESIPVSDIQPGVYSIRVNGQSRKVVID